MMGLSRATYSGVFWVLGIGSCRQQEARLSTDSIKSKFAVAVSVVLRPLPPHFVGRRRERNRVAALQSCKQRERTREESEREREREREKPRRRVTSYPWPISELRAPATYPKTLKRFKLCVRIMSCLQLRAALPLTGQKVASPSLSQSSSHLRAPCSYSFPTKTFNRLKAFPRLVCSRARCQGSRTCLLDGKDKNENGDEVSPSNAAEQPMQFSRKRSSVHDMLRKQMEERESGGGGGSGRDWRGGGGGSDDGGDGRFSANLHELQQVFLATISFMLVYIYLIRREELTRLSSDFIKYLLGGKPSPRLRRTMDAWGRFFQRIKGKKVEEPSEDEVGSSPAW
ncbi:hypothetical protein Taro_016167 [Colocasia esculenta]|uniref:Uncharacterized protein n=1 Tax=Colocasia esculenta TaxID=4460 RepID=A0A843UPG7_COLES|nr:hypothetical protein [Colocasia esculenta]